MSIRTVILMHLYRLPGRLPGHLLYRFLDRLFRNAKALGLILVSMCFSLTATAESQSYGPDVVIIAGEEKVVYEFRQNGQLRLVRVVPKWGKPYNLVPRDATKGFGDLEQADMLVPEWVVVEFE